MSGAETWVIIPVKALAHAKRRLASVLPADARRLLVLTMLEDVLAAIARSEALGRVVVVTPDPQVTALANSKGIAVLGEARLRGLNTAVSAGLAYASARGARQALVLPGDVPLVTPGELRSLVQDAADADRPRVTLAPAADGRGTNALLLSPPDALEPSFGVDSFARHLALAVARRLDTQVLQLPGLAADIDEPKDLERLLVSGSSARYHFLQAHMGRASSSPPHQGISR